MSYFRWWHCGGGDLKKQRGETFSVGSVVEAGPCVTQTLTLEVNYQFFCVQFFTFLCVPCNSTFCGGGSLAKWRRQARPRRRRTKGNRTTNTSLQLFFFYFFKKQFQPTSSVGVPATLNILSSWSKTSLGKHRGEFVSFLKSSISLSKIVDT